MSKFEDYDSFADLLPEDYMPRTKRLGDMQTGKDGVDLEKLVTSDRVLPVRKGRNYQRPLAKAKMKRNLWHPSKWVTK